MRRIQPSVDEFKRAGFVNNPVPRDIAIFARDLEGAIDDVHLTHALDKTGSKELVADPTTGDRVGFLGDLLHRLDKFNGTLVPAPDLFDARFNLLAIGQIDARFNLSHCAPPRVRWSDSDIM